MGLQAVCACPPLPGHSRMGARMQGGWQAAEGRALLRTRVPPGGAPQPSPELAQSHRASFSSFFRCLSAHPGFASHSGKPGRLAGPPSPSLSVPTLQPNP